MIFTLKHIVNSLAGVLKKNYEYPAYNSPNQQGTKPPCFFIFFMPSTIEGQIGERYYRDLGVDIVFVQQRNVVNGNAQIQEIAEFLDESLDLFEYRDGSGKKAYIRTYERQWQSEDEELHYQFHIRQHVALPEKPNTMQELEEHHVGVK